MLIMLLSVGTWKFDKVNAWALQAVTAISEDAFSLKMRTLAYRCVACVFSFVGD